MIFIIKIGLKLYVKPITEPRKFVQYLLEPDSSYFWQDYLVPMLADFTKPPSWFAFFFLGEGECKRQQEPMVCPLCRAIWADCAHENQAGAGAASSTPHPSTAEQGPVEEEAGITESSRLQTFQQKKEGWKEVILMMNNNQGLRARNVFSVLANCSYQRL